MGSHGPAVLRIISVIPHPNRACSRFLPPRRPIPWDAHRTRLYRTIFPQMTNLLPEEEGAQLRFEFETALARLDAA
jgi:hypothetical protein